MNCRSMRKWSCHPRLSTTAMVWRPNHDGKSTKRSSSQQLLWFFGRFRSSCVRFYWIPRFKAKLPETVLRARANASHLWLKWMIWVSQRASGCGHLLHVQTDTLSHTCVPCNYVKPWENAEQTDDLSGKHLDSPIMRSEWVQQWGMMKIWQENWNGSLIHNVLIPGLLCLSIFICMNVWWNTKSAALFHCSFQQHNRSIVLVVVHCDGILCLHICETNRVQHLQWYKCHHAKILAKWV